MIESRFNRPLLWNSLVSIFLGLATMTIAPLVTSVTWPVVLTVLGIYFIIVIGWLCRLKKVTIWKDQIEVRHPFLPFIRRVYWLREFECCHVEQKWEWRAMQESLSLIREGKREVTISTITYANYGELKKALSAISQEVRNTSDVRAVDSVFAKGHLASVLCLLLFVLMGVAILFSDYFEKGQVSVSSLAIGLSVSVLFLSFFVGAIYPYKYLTVWRGRLEVRRMIWPFHVRSYKVDDFDVSLEVITPTQFQQEVSLWLFCRGRLQVCIPQTIYANYDALVNAMGIVPHDRVLISPFKKLGYYLGKKL